MNREQLKTILWLRWRLMCNQWRRTGGLGALIAVFIGVGAISVGLASFAGGMLGGLLGLGKASPQVIMLVWLIVTLVFLFFWMIGLLTELQRSETIDLQKLMHLPVALGQMFGINYLASHFSLSIVAAVPARDSLVFASRSVGWHVDAVKRLAAEVYDKAGADALSRKLYLWSQGRWEVLP